MSEDARVTVRSWLVAIAGLIALAVLVARAAAPASPASSAAPAAPAASPRAAVSRPAAPPSIDDAVRELAKRDLRLPVDAAKVEEMKGQFGDTRDGGTRGHEAVDILAPRNTAVRAVDDGTIARLFLSKPGGITIYQFDSSGRYCYYYAHLDHYAPNLIEQQHVKRGELLGYVGTTGNAPKNTPHLHFAIFVLGDDKRWWKGTAIDPWPVFTAEIAETAEQ